MDKKQTDKKKTQQIVLIILNAVLAIVIIVFIVLMIARKGNDSGCLSEVVKNRTTEKLYANEKVKEVITVDTEIIEDGLREMGTLVTQEYYFTQVEKYSSTESIWIFDSTASFTYSYDGVVAAGINCNKITVSKDDDKKIITISMPRAEITGVTIDNDSFQVYEEKNGLWNKVNTSKVNDSLGKFKDRAKSEAIAKGLLDKADESAEKMILSFAKSVSTDNTYKIEIVRK